jgi:hypothetical protein
MASRASQKVIYAAIAANLAIAACKFSRRFSLEVPPCWRTAVHSTVDTGNELLLLLGLKRSQRPPDPLHPFGHGKVLYFSPWLELSPPGAGRCLRTPFLAHLVPRNSSEAKTQTRPFGKKSLASKTARPTNLT